MLTRWLRCVEAHTAPPGLGWPLAAASEAAAAALVEGHCPCCPGERLQVVTVERCGRPWVYGRCGCCGSLWRTYTAGAGWECEWGERTRMWT